MDLNEHFEKYKSRKYCATHHFPIWKLESEHNKGFKLETRILEAKRLVVTTALIEDETREFGIHDEINITIPIRYCPICGRKLKRHEALEPKTKDE